MLQNERQIGDYAGTSFEAFFARRGSPFQVQFTQVVRRSYITVKVSRCSAYQQVRGRVPTTRHFVTDTTSSRVAEGSQFQRFHWQLPIAQRGDDSIWVMVDRLTKSAHFWSVRATHSVDSLAQIYVRKIVRLHEVPDSLVAARVSVFYNQILEELPDGRWQSVST